MTTGEVSLPVDMSLYDPARFVGKTFHWPEPYDLGIVGDYIAAQKRGETEYNVPYDLTADR